MLWTSPAVSNTPLSHAGCAGAIRLQLCVCVCTNYVFPSGYVSGEVEALLKSLALQSPHSCVGGGAVKHLIGRLNRKLFFFLGVSDDSLFP